MDTESRQIVLNISNEAVIADSPSDNNGSCSPRDATGAKKKKTLVDVTSQYNEEEDDITCGICLGWDPPLQDAAGMRQLIKWARKRRKPKPT